MILRRVTKPLDLSQPLALIVLTVVAVGLAARLPAAPPQFLFGPATPVAELNAPGFGDIQVSLTPDGLEAFFARTTWDPATDLRTSSEIYTARRATTSDAFGTPHSLAELAPPDTWGDSAPSISADGLTLYFGRAPNGASMPSEEDRWPIQGVFAATRPSRDAPFGAPSEITGLKPPTDAAGLGRPEVSADGLSLYFQRVHLNPRDSDVYVSHRAGVNEPWGVAEPIAEFSTSDPAHYLWESAPGVTTDGKGLFLELTWYAGSHADLPDLRGDSSDIYFAQRDGQGGWSKPVNLGDTINLAAGYETDPFLSADGSTLYFNRAESPNGGPQNTTWDLYQAPVLPFSAVPLTGHGSAYQQNFDSLGNTSKTADQAFPGGWTFTANDVIFNNATTQKFPAASHQYAGAFNAGSSGNSDRALATGETQLETGELQFRAHVNGGPVQALRLAVDVEAWQVAKSLAATPGEAAFNVILEADTGKGFEKVADLGRATTGEKLVFPEIGSGLNGNDPANRGSFDSGPLNVSIPEGATLRLRFVPPSETDVVGWTFGLDNLSLHTAAPGDANVDGKVDLADFGMLKANFGKDGHFTDGDFSGNGTVDLSDFGLLKDNFGKSAPAAVPEPSSLTLAACGAIALLVLGRRSTALGRQPVQRRQPRRASTFGVRPDPQWH